MQTGDIMTRALERGYEFASNNAINYEEENEDDAINYLIDDEQMSRAEWPMVAIESFLAQYQPDKLEVFNNLVEKGIRKAVSDIWTDNSTA